MKVRTRVAPSPTGYVHVGTLYNAIFAHALAKNNSGDFVLRIEDTDQTRSIDGATEELLHIFEKFDVNPDEGPVQGGEYGPYIQSEKAQGDAYKNAALKLIENGHAYYCFHTKEELENFRKENEKRKVREVFRSKYREMDKEDALKKIDEGEEYVIRLKVPENETISVEDAILGHIEWNSSEIDDQVLLKSDGFPTYHLAVVVDDNDMKITHITRGYDWVPSTPKQILLYKYLGYELPVYAHNGLILDPNGGKLSKRKGNVSVSQFLKEGYLPEAMLNFLILIGWSADIVREHGESEREIFSHEEFISMYKLKDRKKTSGVFDINKLNWFNSQYISIMTTSKLRELVLNWMNEYNQDVDYFTELKSKIIDLGDEYLESILELEKTRIKRLDELPEVLYPFYFNPNYEEQSSIKQIKKLSREQLVQIGVEFLTVLEKLGKNTSEWEHELWENEIRKFSDKLEIKHGQSFMSLRYIITGRSFSPPLFEVMQILGADEIKSRINEFTKD